MDEAKQNKTNEIKHDLLPENTVTVVIKCNGKVYSQGARIGNIHPEMPDEDLDSTLRAVRGLGLSTVKTLAHTIAARPGDYPIPTTDVEEDDAPALAIMLADEDLKAGDPVVIDVEKGRARKPTDEEVTYKNARKKRQ